MTPDLTLTAQDRCDRCSAAALVAVMLPAGGTLLFCGHHHRDHADALTAAGAITVNRQDVPAPRAPWAPPHQTRDTPVTPSEWEGTDHD